MGIGTGGGHSFERARGLLARRDDVLLVGVDNMYPFALMFKRKVKSASIIAGAGSLPFADSTISAINASAVLHEISTYGVGDYRQNRKKGIAAISHVLQEASRTLLPGGALAYRDVYCPENRRKIKLVCYRERSWHLFVRAYLPWLITAYGEIIGSIVDKIAMKQKGSNLWVKAPVQIHREIQRHYITFRDYFRKVVAPNVGVTVKRETWKNVSAGIKEHAVVFSLRTTPLTVTLDSDIYDALTDAIIIDQFEQSGMMTDWFKREGSELYTLMSVKETIALVKKLDRRKMWANETF